MQRLEPLEANDAVKLRKHAVKIVCNVVAGIAHVTGIETHTKQLVVPGAINDARQLLKAATDLTSLARHCLEQHRGGKTRLEHLIEPLANELYAAIDALLDVAARVKVVVVSWQALKTCEVLGHGTASEVDRLLVGRAKVHGIGRVGHERTKAVFCSQLHQSRRVYLVERLYVAATRVPGKEGKGVGANL